jgi:hypothetical protein
MPLCSAISVIQLDLQQYICVYNKLLVKFIEVDIHLMLSFEMARYYLEGYQWLMVPSSEIAPRQGSPRGLPQTQRGAVIGGTSAAHRDAKPGTEPVEVLNRAQSPADKSIIEMSVYCGSVIHTSAMVFTILCSRTPRYNFSSTLYPQSC